MTTRLRDSCLTLALLPLAMLACSLAHAGDGPHKSETHGARAGRVLGKLVGILVFTYLAVKLHLCDLPAGARWGQIAGVGLMASVGFTVSLFVTNLAFEDANLVAFTKLGLFLASILAGALGRVER